MLKKIYMVGLAVVLMVLGLAQGVLSVRGDTVFPQTGVRLFGPFEDYWKGHGGLAQFGLPRTPVFSGADSFDAQWFERALFTYTPSNPEPYKVQLQLLGNVAARGRVEAAFHPLLSQTTGHFYPATGHSLAGKFFDYWSSTGGLPVYGYPISEPFTEQSKADGKTYQVQYFERNRFELHPELAGTRFEVQLGLLGSEMLDAQGGPTVVASLPQPRFYPATSAVAVPTGGVVDASGPTPLPTSIVTVPPAPLLPALPASNQALYQDDFSSSGLVNWSPSSLLVPSAQPAPWRVMSGRLEQWLPSDEADAAEESFLLLKDVARQSANATLDVEFYSVAGDGIGAVSRVNSGGAYMVRLFGALPNKSPKAQLLRVDGTRATLLATAQAGQWPGYSRSAWQHLTFSTVGGQLTVQVEGKTVLQASDTTYSSGGFGLYALANGTAKFDNLRISTP
ncbi:MAG: hypothetical protein M3014_12700 [Chloroflexota bacterium]|nr:hypothetical protein [Chloroflexota bacterium]